MIPTATTVCKLLKDSADELDAIVRGSEHFPSDQGDAAIQAALELAKARFQDACTIYVQTLAQASGISPAPGLLARNAGLRPMQEARRSTIGPNRTNGATRQFRTPPEAAPAKRAHSPGFVAVMAAVAANAGKPLSTEEAAAAATAANKAAREAREAAAMGEPAVVPHEGPPPTVV